jgi:hypothetical protein
MGGGILRINTRHWYRISSRHIKAWFATEPHIYTISTWR